MTKREREEYELIKVWWERPANLVALWWYRKDDNHLCAAGGGNAA
jgi:hypothetical protein